MMIRSQSKYGLYIFLISFFIFTSVFAQQDDYYIHQTGVFKIIPPTGFNKIIASENGVQFNNQIDKSFLSIRFFAVEQGYAEDELLGRFNNDEFRGTFIDGLEKSSVVFKTKVVSDGQINFNGIPAWEFTTEGLAVDGGMANNIIVCYKSNREFFIMFSKDSNSKNLIKQSLASFEVLK